MEERTGCEERGRESEVSRSKREETKRASRDKP